ncbi:hypothetical protein [Pseudoalteromonas ruthenica]|uniref:hypothetical protein n=1 Tax=Pseudoalteromonas ruthenica TaxID=151081 RepID=UPI0011092955|nr:hypothetical protein [Pseudoalteromonas ruthenica]
MSYQPSREVFSKPKSANAQLAEFVRKSPTCEYPAISYLSTEKYAGLISERVRNPWKINQKETYLCGPNAYLFCLATSHKEYYVKYMLDLWTFGEASIAGLYVKPSNSCLNFNVQLS